jgi:hypothetical protein
VAWLRHWLEVPGDGVELPDGVPEGAPNPGT